MKRFTLFLSIILLLISFQRTVNAQESPSVTPQPTVYPAINEEITDLRRKMNDLRNENYQNVIRASENTIAKADSLVGTMSMLVTVLGGFFALVTFVFTVIGFIFGRNLSDLIRQLNTHVARAKNAAQLIESKAKEIDTKRKKIEELAGKIEEAKKQLDQTSVKGGQKVKEIEATITQLKKEANEAINQVKTLSNSASFISNATVTPVSFSPFGTISQLDTAGVVNVSPVGTAVGTVEVPKTCRRCHRVIWDEPHAVGISIAGVDDDLCESCKRQSQTK